MKNLLNIGGVINCKHIEEHSHTMWEMIYYTKGSVQLTLDGEKHILSPGVFVCQPPFKTHTEVGLDNFDNYFFSVSEFDVLPNRPIIIRDTVDCAIKSLVQHMHIVFSSKPANYRPICEALLNTIVQYVLSQMGDNNIVNPYVKEFAMTLLSNAPNCNFRISAVEMMLPFSSDYFRLMFKRDMGCTPVEYLSRIRMSNAKDLLSSNFQKNSLSISNISFMCGFSDPLYFSRCFKRNTGMTPSEWAKMVKAEVPDIT